MRRVQAGNLEEDMMSAPALVADEHKTRDTEFTLTQSEAAPLAEAPEITPGAWKAIIFLLIGGVLFLATLGAYVFSALHRFQNCL